MRATMVIISKTKDPSDSSAGAGVFLAAAAAPAVVALAVLGPIAHDGGAVEPSHGGLSVGIMRCNTGGCSKTGESVMGKHDVDCCRW